MVKVPPPDERNFTRRTVAGAAGGMLGVDYEDERQPDPSTVKATTGTGSNRDSPGAEVSAQQAIAEETGLKRARKTTDPKDESEMILDDEDATTRDEKTKQRTRRSVARDRMTVDKDAPRLLHKRPWDQDDEPPPEEPDDIDLEALAEAIASAGDPIEGIDHRRWSIGDARLTDPHAIKEALGSPVAYAKHCVILAEAFRSSTGARRSEAVRYLALMFAALGDRNFARQALKELGPATGIVDLYPLEVIEEVVESYPGLLSKVGFGTLFVRPKKSLLELEAGVTSLLTYPESLKIRGFAIKGGDRPGYRFEPHNVDGQYALTISAPGRYHLLISGVTRSGHTVIDRIDTLVRDGPHAIHVLPEPEPIRDAAKVDAWPRPEPIPIDFERLLDRDDASRQDDSSSVLSSGELVSRQQMGALRVAADERSFEIVDAPARVPPEKAAPPSDDPKDALSRAEASLLRLAVAVGTDDADVQAAPLADEDED